MNCPVCSGPTVVARIDGRAKPWCMNCRTPLDEMPAKPSARKGVPTTAPLEKDVVALIVAALTARGYLVDQIGQRNAKKSATTKGFPDLVIRNPAWPQGLGIGFEVKRDLRSVWSAEQLERLKSGRSFGGSSIQEAIDAAQATDVALGIEPRRQ